MRRCGHDQHTAEQPSTVSVSRPDVDLSEYFENGLVGRTSLFYRSRCRYRYSADRFLSDDLSIVCVTPAALSLSHLVAGPLPKRCLDESDLSHGRTT